MLRPLKNARNHIYKHRAKYTAVLVITVAGVLIYVRAAQWNAFLESKGINPAEFYLTPEDFAEFTATQAL